MRRYTIYLCEGKDREAHVNGTLWDVGCEHCFGLTHPVEVVSLDEHEAAVKKAYDRGYREAKAPPRVWGYDG